MKIYKRICALILGAVMLTLQTAVFAEDKTESKVEKSEGYVAWENIAEYVSQMYIDETLTKEDIMLMGMSNYLEDEDAMVALLKKTLESLDPYSTFMTYDEYVNYSAQLDGVMFGLGVTIEQRDDGIYITDFAEESLAPEAGFCVGDRIYSVGGINVEESSIEEVRSLIVGELDTTVVIVVDRGGELFELTGTRCAVNTATISGGILNGNIGYVQILSFGSNTAGEVRGMLDTFYSSGVKKLIVDLRDNTGGLLSSAVAISKMLVKKGKIIDVTYRAENLNQSYYSDLEKTYYDTIVLVNENTASSAEILASAMQESGSAKLYGTQTYGKGIVQATFPLNNGSIIKMTTGEYITRNGKKINEIGLEPDVYVENYAEKIEVGQYTKFNFTDKWSLGDTGMPVKAAKERLYMLGYFNGNTTNDTFNVQLQDAIKAYQAQNGLSASGVLDIPTQVQLENTFGSLEKEVDVQLRRAYEAFGGNADELYN